MKKIMILLLLTIFSFTLFANNKELNQFSKVDTFKATITETSNINNETRTKEYDILAKLPGQLKKIMISPNINKGEIYLYNNSEKKIYYPLLEQTIIQKIDKNENYTLKFFKDLKTYNTNNNKDYKIIVDKGIVNEIIYNDGVSIQFKKFLKINGINFPTHVKILDGDMLISEIFIKNIATNTPLSEKDFSIDETTQN